MYSSEIDTEQNRVLAKLLPCKDRMLGSYLVNSKVNNPKNNGPVCVARV